MAISSTEREINRRRSKVFRRAFIKRRLPTSGLFESEWQEITEDIKKWGKITGQLDAIRFGKLKFGNMSLKLANDEGKYNNEEDENSLWFNHGPQQRTLFKIEAGFTHQTLASSGQWFNIEWPGNVVWDDPDVRWDMNLWDDNNVTFKGIISGDAVFNDSNEVSMRVRPLSQIFRDYSANNLIGLNNSLTASGFIELLRDQTDGAGSFIFRPFFDDTTTNWNISTTTVIYSNLDTNTAEDVRDSNVWQIIEKLAEAESAVAYVSKSGEFNFRLKSDITTTVAFEFHGQGSTNTEFGQTIKRINSFSRSISKFFSRVEVQFSSENTSTAFAVQQSSLTVSGNNTAWNYGQRTLKIDNTFIPTATAASIASSVFTEASSIKEEIDFNTSFVPHLDILDRVSITYDSSGFTTSSLWDRQNWASSGSTVASTDLIWDNSKGDAIKLNAKEFKFLSFNIDLDKFECNFKAREV